MSQSDGADLLSDKRIIETTFPRLSDEVQAVIHARRCGAISAQQLGMYLVEEAKKLSVRKLRGELTTAYPASLDGMQLDGEL